MTPITERAEMKHRDYQREEEFKSRIIGEIEREARIIELPRFQPHGPWRFWLIFTFDVISS